MKINKINFETVAHYLREAQEKEGKELEKISSGKQINRASDGVAEISLITKLKAQVRSLKQATRNANDGISIVQVAEGGLGEISSVLMRLRELCLQSATDTVGDSERNNIQKEFQQLLDGIDQMSDSNQID
ncbi:MAG: flagellin, partial [Pseudomonadota bacterium]